MKIFAIFLISLSLAHANVADLGSKLSERDIAPAAQNITQCVFKAEGKVIECRGVAGDVECPAVFEWPVSGVPSYKVFGLGVAREFSGDKAELVRYWLYPRMLNNVTYVNHTVLFDGAVRDIFLYFGEKFVEYGFRVTDIKCFGRLIGLIRKSSFELMIPLESDLVVKPVVPMIGEVLVFDKDVSKRWLFSGIGFGFGWPLWNPFFRPWGIWGR